MGPSYTKDPKNNDDVCLFSLLIFFRLKIKVYLSCQYIYNTYILHI